jgi:hypothetical protein
VGGGRLDLSRRVTLPVLATAAGPGVAPWPALPRRRAVAFRATRSRG